MPSIFGRLVKINAQKKLMVRVTERTFHILSARSFELGRREFGEATGMPVAGMKLATFSLENEQGDDIFFCMITLDKYDKQLIERKFEPLLRKDVVIDYKLDTYSFRPEDTLIQGVHIILTRICPYRGVLKFDDSDSDDEVDEIADAAAARAISATVGPISSLTAEEKEVDEVIAPLIAERFNMPAPPPLIRQNAVAAPDMSGANSNRRRSNAHGRCHQ